MSYIDVQQDKLWKRTDFGCCWRFLLFYFLEKKILGFFFCFYSKEMEKNFFSSSSWLYNIMHSFFLLVPKMAWGISWILMRVVASLKICTLMYYFCRKYILFKPITCREVMWNNTEEWYKIWKRAVVCFWKMTLRNLANFDSTIKCLKIITLMGSL